MYMYMNWTLHTQTIDASLRFSFLPRPAVELLPQKDVGVTLEGVGKTCCGKEWVASNSLHF